MADPMFVLGLRCQLETCKHERDALASENLKMAAERVFIMGGDIPETIERTRLVLVDRANKAEDKLAAAESRCRQVEAELAELQRTKFGTPCKCESWIEACGQAEERAEELSASLATVTAERDDWRNQRHDLESTLFGILHGPLGLPDDVTVIDMATRIVQELTEARSARERVETALRGLAIDAVTAGANPQRDGSMSPPLWHMTCRLCDARWSKQTWKRAEAEALHPPHASQFSKPCLLTPTPPPAQETERQP